MIENNEQLLFITYETFVTIVYSQILTYYIRRQTNKSKDKLNLALLILQYENQFYTYSTSLLQFS